MRKKWSGRRGSNSQLSAWEAKLPPLYFHNLQNRSRKINVHALHTVHAVHAVPDLRIAGGRLGDVARTKISIIMESLSVIAKALLLLPKQLTWQL